MDPRHSDADGEEVLVVGRTDLGEADRIVRLLSARRGRIDVVARGARRSRRRFGGALEPGTRLRARWRTGRGALPSLNEVDVLAQPARAREDYDRLVLLTYGCDLLATLSEEALEGEKGFRLLESWLDLLEGEVRPDVASRLALEAKALTFSGLTPALVRCPVCGEATEGELLWDLEAGGGVHPWCGQGTSVAAEHLHLLERLRRTPLADTPGVPVPAPVHWRLADFVEHHARRPLKSRALISPELG